MQDVDSTGRVIEIGDVLASPYKDDLRFLYLITGVYDNSLRKPYIYRQVGEGELEVVGRTNQEIDLSTLTFIDNAFDNPDLIPK